MAVNAPLAVGPGLFTEEEFQSAAKQVIEPDLTSSGEWTFFVETHNTKIYRNYIEATGLYEYKTFGVMEDLDPEACAQVYVDWEYRKAWDSYVLDLYPIKHQTTGIEGLYWCIDYPWPMSDRDYTFIRDMKVMEVGGMKTWVVLARSHPFPSVPEKSGVIRVDDFTQACVMQGDGKVGARAFMHYYDNPKGMIPTWLINWAAKTGVPQFMETMRTAVKGYPEFLERKRVELGVEKLDNEDRLRRMYNVAN